MEFELTVRFNHKMGDTFGKIIWIKWNFELTVLKLTVPDLYIIFTLNFKNVNVFFEVRISLLQNIFLSVKCYSPDFN